MARFYRCRVFWHDDLFRLARPCRCRVLGYDDLAGAFLLVRFYRRRMLGYDDLACLTRPCRSHVLGHHGLTRMFGLCRCRVFWYDDLFRLARPCRRHVLGYDDLTRRCRLTRPCRHNVLGHDDLFRLARPCRCRVLRYDDLAGAFLLVRFYRRRMFGYDDLACLTRPCRSHVLGHHGLTRMFGLCRCRVFRYDDLFRLARLCRRHVLGYDDLSGLGWRDSPSGTLDLLLLKCYFRFGSVHLIGRDDIVCGLRRYDPGLAVDLAFLDTLHLFLENGGIFLLALANDRIILVDSVDHGIVRLLFYRYVRVVVPLFVRRVIVDHRVTDDRRSAVVIDHGDRVYVGHLHFPVIVHTVEIVPGNHDSTACIGIVPDVDVDPCDIDIGYDHIVRASPIAAAVVCLARRQRHPAHIISAVDP